MFEQERRERLRSPEQRVGTLPNGALPPPAGSDEDLLTRALVARDERAFGIVLERLSPSMMHVAMSHVRSRAEAEDVVQDTWLGALRSIDRFEHRSSLRTWLFRILKNRARTHGAKAARTVVFSDLQPAAHPDLAATTFVTDGYASRPDPHLTPEPERALLARELGDSLARALEQLPTRQRAVIVMRDVEGRSSAEVGRSLGISDGNQRVLLHRARTRIRDQLAGYLDDEERRVA